MTKAAVFGALLTAQAAVAQESTRPAKLPPTFTVETVYLWEKGSRNDLPTKMTPRPKMDVYYPKKAVGKPLAVVLICPGGGYYLQADDHEGKQLAEYFAANGLASAVLYYRVEPHRHPAPYADACRATRLLRHRATRYHLDPQRLAILGFSAGGHLASTVATMPDLYRDPDDDLATTVLARPDRAVLCYPVITLVPPYAHAGSADNLLGPRPDSTLLRQLSTDHQVTARTPPTFLWHTAEDDGVPPQNSLLFAQACADAHVPVELHLFQKGKHGLGMAPTDPALRVWPALLLTWLADWRKK